VIQPGSEVGYRAHETFVQLQSPNIAVARTDRISGWLLVADQGGAIRLEAGCVAVDLGSLQSVDQLPGLHTTDRDETVRNLLHTSDHPFAEFQIYPVSLKTDLPSGTQVHVRLFGALELNGVNKSAAFDLDIRRSDDQVAAAGNTTVAVGDYGVDVPQGAEGFVSVDPQIMLGISLVMLKPSILPK
jgi:hypothetical protein